MATDFAALGISVDTGDLKRAITFLDKLGKEAGQTEKQTNKLATSSKKLAKESDNLAKKTLNVNAAMTKLAGTLSLLALVQKTRELVQFADSMTLLDSRIKISTKSTEDYVKASKLLVDISLRTGTELKSNIILFTRINKSIGDMGGTIHTTARVTETLVKALTISGATASETTSVVRQMSQALASGVLRGDEFNSIVENGARVQGILADSLNVTKGQLRDMAQTGQLTSTKVINALIEQSKTIDAEFARMPVTVNRALNNITTQFGQYVLVVNKGTGATAGLADGLNLLADNLIPVVESIVTLGKVALAVFAGSLIKSLSTYTITKKAAIELEHAHSLAIKENIAITHAKSIADRTASESALALLNAKRTDLGVSKLSAQSGRESINIALVKINADINLAKSIVNSTAVLSENTLGQLLNKAAVEKLTSAQLLRSEIIKEQIALQRSHVRVSAAITEVEIAQGIATEKLAADNVALAASEKIVVASTVTLTSALKSLATVTGIASLAMGGFIAYEVGTWLGDMSTGMESVGIGLVLLGGALSAAVAITGSFTIVVNALTVAMLANPVTAFAVALGASIAAVTAYKNATKDVNDFSFLPKAEAMQKSLELVEKSSVSLNKVRKAIENIQGAGGQVTKELRDEFDRLDRIQNKASIGAKVYGASILQIKDAMTGSIAIAKELRDANAKADKARLKTVDAMKEEILQLGTSARWYKIHTLEKQGFTGAALKEAIALYDQLTAMKSVNNTRTKSIDLVKEHTKAYFDQARAIVRTRDLLSATRTPEFNTSDFSIAELNKKKTATKDLIKLVEKQKDLTSDIAKEQQAIAELGKNASKEEIAAAKIALEISKDLNDALDRSNKQINEKKGFIKTLTSGIEKQTAAIEKQRKENKRLEDERLLALSNTQRAIDDLASFGDLDNIFPTVSEESLRILDKYANEGIPKLKDELEKLEGALQEQKKVWGEWSGVLSGTFSQLLSDGDSFTQNLADMFDSMIDRMLQSALKFASDNIIQGLFAKGGINWGQSLFGAAVGAAAIGVSYLLSDDEPTRQTFAPSRTQTSGDDRALGFSDMVDVDRTSRKVASDTIYAQELIAFRQLNLNISKASSNFIHKLTSVSGETTDIVTDVFSSVFPKTSEFFTGLSNQLSDFGNSIVDSSSLLGGLSDTIDGVADVTKLATDALSIGFGELTDSIGLTTTAALEAELATLAPIDTTSGALAQEGIDIGGSATNASAVSSATKTLGAVVGVLTAAYEVYTLVSGWSELTTGGQIMGVIGAVAAVGAAVVGIGVAAGLIGAAVAAAATVVGIVVAAGLLIASFFVGGSKKPKTPKLSLFSGQSSQGSSRATSRLGVVSAESHSMSGKSERELDRALQANVENIAAVDNVIANALEQVDKITGDDTIGLFRSAGASFRVTSKLKGVDFAQLINKRMNWLANNLALTGTPAGIAFNAWFDFFDRAFGDENSLGIAANVANSLGALMELPLELIGLLNNNIKSFQLGGTPEDAVKEIESILLTFATLKAGFELLGADNISDKNIVAFLAKLNNVGFAVNEAGASLLQYAQVLEESGLNISYGINQLFKFADDSNFDKRQYSAFFSVVGSFASLGQSLGVSAEGFGDFVGIANIVSDLASSTLDSAKYESLQDQAVKYGGLTVTEARAEIESLGIALGDAILEVVNNVVFLSNALEISGNSFASMGKSLLETVEFSQELIETMGGIEKAQDKWSAFIDAMYSDIEKANTRYIQTTRNANLLLDSIGLGGLAFDEFRVAFDDALPRLSAQDVNNWVDTGIAIGAANDAMAAASDLIASQFEEINNAASQRYENELQYINQINDYVEGLLVNEALSPLTNKERLVETQSQFAVQLSAAKAGDPEALSDVTNFANKYLTEARNFYASGDAYQNIFDSVTSSLLGVTDSLGVTDTDPLHVIDNTIKEQTLALIESSSLDTSIIIDALERVFSYDQLDSFGLIPTEAELQTTSDMDFINSLFQDAFGFLPDEFNFDLWMDKLISGESRLLVSSQFQTLQDPFKDIPKYADGGFHSGGLAVVGENGAELVNFSRPSQIYTSSQTSDILGGNSESSKELVDLIKQLIEENRELTESLIEATYDSSEQNAESINTNASKRMPTKMELS